MLQGKTAIVTGARRGIGKSIVEKFASEGADVFAHARSKDEAFEKFCDTISKKYGVMVEPVYFDLCKEEEMKEGISRVRKSSSKIDILVNNAGIVNSVKLFPMTTMQEIKDSFEVNFFATMLLTQYISRLMIRKCKGSIINISSCAALDGDTGMLEYVSSKGAMVSATKRLAIELGNYNIRVNSVAPGLTETDMGNMMSEQLEKETIARTIMKRKAKPEEIANMAAFLASDLASYITGQIYRVDGGMIR